MASEPAMNDAPLQRRMRPLLGTFVEVAVVEMEQGDTALESAFLAIEEVQRLLSFHDAKSDLSRLNRSCGEVVALHPLSLRVLRLARAMTRHSGGLFNCTVGGTLVAVGVLPDHGGESALPSGAADDLEIGRGYARLRRPLRITLDGIAKGYAVDCAVKVLKAHGASGGWVNAGGDLRSFGTTVIPVQRRELDGSLTLLGGVQNGALASSAVYPQREGSFPAHIVRDGRATEQCGVWSVMARSAWRADALTKVAALAPQAECVAIIEKLGGRLV